MNVDTKIRKVLNMVNGADKRVFAEALRDPREFGTRARTPLEALQEVDTALVDLYLESEQNADIFVEGLKKMGRILVMTVHKSICGGASPLRLNHDFHAIDATPARWRGGVVSHRSIQSSRSRSRRERTS